MNRKGFVTWGSIETAFETTAGKIIDAGFETFCGKKIIPSNTNKSAFGKAVKKVKKLFDLRECDLAVKDQRFKNNADDARIAIVRPRVDSDGKYRSEDFCICRFDGESVWCESDGARIAEVDNFENDMRTEYNRQRREEIVSSSQLRAIYEKATKIMRRIPLRGTQLQFGDKKNGGIYLIPEVFEEELNRLVKLFEKIGPGCNIGTIETYDTERSMSMIQQSADFEYRQKCIDLVTKIDGQVADGTITKAKLEGHHKQAKLINEGILLQRDLLSDAAKKIEQDVDLVGRLINERLNLAEGEIPKSLAEEMDRINAAADAGEVIDDSAELESRISADELTPVSDIWGDDSTVDLSTTKSIWDDLA